MSKKAFLQKLSDCVVEMEDEKIVEVIKDYIQLGYDPEEGMLKGLVDGMKRANELYEEEEYYIPELMLCSDTMYAGITEFRSYLPKKKENQGLGKIIIGVAQGDTHDIGKNLVKILLETSGFDVIDLGRDVPSEKFVEEAIEKDADVIALSTLMSTTMFEMERVVEILEQKGIHEKVKVIVGGAAVSQKFADEIGADGYSDSATGAIRLVKSLLDIA